MFMKLFNSKYHSRHGDDVSFGGRGRRGHGRHHEHGSDEHESCEHGSRERGRGHGGRGRGGKSRLFEHGNLRIVLLALVAKKPSHGYELIKAIEEASSGLYTPSPGVIYPTLTLLEEQEYLQSFSSEKGRKSYQITAEGEQELKENQKAVEIIFQRLSQAGDERGGNLAEEISEAMHSLKALLRHHLMRKDLTAEQISRIATTLNDAVKQIETELQTSKDKP